MDAYPITPDLYQPWALEDHAYAQYQPYLTQDYHYQCNDSMTQSLNNYNPYFAEPVQDQDYQSDASLQRHANSYNSTYPHIAASDYSSTANSPRLRPELARHLSDYERGLALSQHDIDAYRSAPHGHSTRREYHFVDPSMIHAQSSRSAYEMEGVQQSLSPYSQTASPLPSPSMYGPQRNVARAPMSSRSRSPYVMSARSMSFPQGSASPLPMSRYYDSLPSRSSPATEPTEPSEAGDASDAERVQCPLAECGKSVKDLKAHMLTHQTERPEKCPIVSCDYHVRGFARRYDKNRHTLTHYKGAMICPWCPKDKSFNRADVFKRHLTAAHGVDQANVNNRSRKSPALSTAGKASYFAEQQVGTCSTCNLTLNSPTEFYEHLDDCVLQIVQRSERHGLVNEKHLRAGSRNSNSSDTACGRSDDEEQYAVEASMASQYSDYLSATDNRADSSDDITPTNEHPSGGGSTGSKGRRKRPSMTYSKGDVQGAPAGSKRKKNLPSSWACPISEMKVKKRVLTAWSAQRRVVEDEMANCEEAPVQPFLLEADLLASEIDIQTLARADAFLDMSPEEMGLWIPDNYRNMV